LSSSEASRDEFAPSAAYSNYVLGLLLLVAAFNLLDRQIFGMLVESIKQEFGVSDTWIGLLTGFSYAVFYTAAGIPVARWADRGVRRSIIALGLLLWSGLTMASGFVTSFGYLVAARIGVGIGEAAGTPPSHSLISDYFPPARRATALATMSVGSALGVMMSYFAGGWLNELYGWRVVLITFGAPGMLLALLIRLTLREPPRGRFDARSNEARPSLREALGFLLRLRSYRHLVLGASLHSFAFAGASFWYPPFLSRVHGLSSGEIGTLLALLSSLTSATGIYVGGRVCDRLGKRDVRWYMGIPAIGSIASVPFSILFLFMPSTTAAFLCLAPASFLTGFAIPGMHAVTQGLAPPSMRSLASAINLLMLSLIGMGLGPTIVGVLNDVLAPRLGDESIRYSLAIIAVTAIWSGIHKLLSARALPGEFLANEKAT
jgi:MFS family permease